RHLGDVHVTWLLGSGGMETRTYMQNRSRNRAVARSFAGSCCCPRVERWCTIRPPCRCWIGISWASGIFRPKASRMNSGVHSNCKTKHRVTNWTERDHSARRAFLPRAWESDADELFRPQARRLRSCVWESVGREPSSYFAQAIRPDYRWAVRHHSAMPNLPNGVFRAGGHRSMPRVKHSTWTSRPSMRPSLRPTMGDSI
ncbi:MAG: hypothetical protein ACI8QS_002988, partial [Planctomycetota bacterium]